MSKITSIEPRHGSLTAPSALQDISQWLIWRYETVPGEPKARKIPYYTDGGKRFGKQGSPEDRARLVSFAAARDAAVRRGFDGVGLAMLDGTGITALDFDNCVDGKGNLPKDITDIISDTYAEYSPSGKGVRAFVMGDLGNHKSSGPDYGFETFSSSGFVTVTGNPVWTTEVFGNEDRIAGPSQQVLDLCQRRFGYAGKPVDSDPEDFMIGHEPRLGLTVEEMEQYLSVLDADMPREHWVRVGMALHHETEGDDTGFDLWNAWSEQGGKYPSEEALRQQWDSFTRREGSNRRQVTMASVIKMAKQAGYSANSSAIDPSSIVEDMVAVATEAEGTGNYAGRFPVIAADAFSRRQPPEWLIKGVVPKADLVVLYGASGSGKTFVALDMGVSMARGVEWRGRRTKKARVVMIAAEGGGGMANRLKAYCLHHGLDASDLDLGVICGVPNFLMKDDVSDVVASIAASGGADIVIVDTFAQVTPGANENAGEDMGRALAHARGISEALGAVVMLVHHAGKDASKGARGWSGIRAAADAELEVVRFDTGHRMLRTSKQKDGDDGLEWGFELELVTLGVDADGDEITSCVAIEAELTKPTTSSDEPKGKKQLGKWGQHVLETIALFDINETQIPINELLDKAVSTWPAPEAGERDVRRQNLIRTIKGMAAAKDEPPFVIENGMVVLL